MTSTRWNFAWALSFSLVLLAAACGDSDSPPDGASSSAIASPADEIEEIEQEVDEAGQSTEPLQGIQGQDEGTMDVFLTDIINEVDSYWTTTLTAAGLTEPLVSYNWLAPGASTTMSCTDPAGVPVVTDDETAAYCPPDDTIFVSQQFAYELWNTLIPGKELDTTIGDAGVAFVIAHEYAHNVQQELGIFSLEYPTKQTELEADCWAGVWMNSVFHQGLLETGDVEEAVATANKFGDYDILSEGHHGTPAERIEAWEVGYNTGDPGICIMTYTPV